MSLELWGYGFARNALLASTLLGILASTLGVFVLLRGMSFVGAGISHAAFGGAALGYALGFDPLVSALAFSLGGALLLPSARGKLLKEDGGVGIFFSFGMALGLLVLGFLKGTRVDLFGYLFGNVLAVDLMDLLWLSAIASLSLGFVLAFYRKLLLSTFDPDFARVIGIRVELLDRALLLLVSACVVVGMKVVGAVLVSAMLVIPAATARYAASSFLGMIFASAMVGLASSWVGLWLSFELDLPPGPAMVLTSSLLFALARIYHSLRGR